MKKLSPLLLASAILFFAMPLSAIRRDTVVAAFDVLTIAAIVYAGHLYFENKDLKAKLKEAQSNQQKPKENILDKDKDIRLEQAK